MSASPVFGLVLFFVDWVVFCGGLVDILGEGVYYDNFIYYVGIKMNPVDRLAKMLLLAACTLVVLALFSGCSKVKQSVLDERAAEEAAKEDEENAQLNAHNQQPEKMANKSVVAVTPARVMVKGKPIDVPAPELENINKYAAALEEHLLRRYNNTPGFAGKVAKVRLLAEKEPEFSLDRKKIRMSWSQVVFDPWGKRISELEEEYYVVTFGDGKPLMQRTRPSISIGLNNESGYSEYDRVRGGALSKMEYVADPGMFDKPSSQQVGLLDDHLGGRDVNQRPYEEYDIEPIKPPQEKKKFESKPRIRVIEPAEEDLQAIVVLKR